MATVNQYRFYGKTTTAAESVDMLEPGVNETIIVRSLRVTNKSGSNTPTVTIKNNNFEIVNTQQLATATSVEILSLPLIVEGVPDKDYSAVDNLDRAIERARERSDRQDEGKGPGGSTFDYSDPYDPGGGEKDGGFIDGTNRRQLNVGGLAGMLGY